MSLRLPAAVAAASLTLALGAGLVSAASEDAPREPTVTRDAVSAADSAGASAFHLDRRVFGHSGALRVAVVQALDAFHLPFVDRLDGPEGVSYRWVPLFGTPNGAELGDLRFSGLFQAPAEPGAWRLQLRAGEAQRTLEELTVITQVPLSAKQGARLNGYHIGTYPVARGLYAPPAGFIEVTPQNRDLQLSKNFRVGQFLTKDQFNVWPKYVAIDLRLIDKLELVLQELQLMGVRADRFHVMSGFRTPQYNGPGGNGRAQLSRHTVGDAADVWVENGERYGYMADLNGDGRRDEQDALVLLQAVERVEQRYPDLVGGAGVYRSNGARGPFVHIDVRGSRSRW